MNLVELSSVGIVYCSNKAKLGYISIMTTISSLSKMQISTFKNKHSVLLNEKEMDNMWTRNMYTGPGGGAYTGPGGGMYTGPGGGAYTGPGGGMYTGPGGGAYTGPGGGLYTGPGGGAYTGPGGGAYIGPGGGLYTGPGGGLHTGPGGGMYTGPDSNPFKAIFPPWPMFATELRKIGMINEAKMIEDALRSIGWRA